MSLHLKRLAAPRAWHVPKKAAVWVTKPIPGPHGQDESIPIGLVLRDYLKMCDRAAEAKRIVQNGDVLVDGKAAFSPKQAVGFMDVLSIPKVDESYRVLFDYHGRVVLHPVAAAQAAWKLCRVEGKTTIAGGKTQVNLHDGRNFIVKEANAYKSGDSVKLHVPDQKVMGHFPLAAGATAFVTGGAHIAQSASVVSVEKTLGSAPNLVHLKAGETAFTTIKPYVFVIGKDRPEITVPTGGA